MNLTVREESGAWSLLKNAPVRARDTASSSEGMAVPKFPGTVAGAEGPLYTPSIRPRRSTTAIALESESAAVAAASTSICTSAWVKKAVAGGGWTGGVMDEPPPLPPPQFDSIAHSGRMSARQRSSRSTGPDGFRLSGDAVIPQPTKEFHEADGSLVSQ